MGFGMDNVRRIDPTLAKLCVLGFEVNLRGFAAEKSTLKEDTEGKAASRDVDLNGGGNSAGRNPCPIN